MFLCLVAILHDGAEARYVVSIPMERVNNNFWEVSSPEANRIVPKGTIVAIVVGTFL